MKESFYVEFIGFPASGKTHYANILIRYLKKKNVESNNFNKINKIYKFFLLLIFILRYPYYSIQVLNIFFNRKLKDRDSRKHFYYFINEASLRIYHKYKKKIIINSEGFRYRSVYYLNFLKKNFFVYDTKKFVKLLPKVHLLIFIDSSKKINLKRSKKRKNGYKYTSKDLKDYSKNKKIIKKICMETKKNAIVFKITKSNKKKNLKKIFNIINKVKLNYEKNY